MNVDKLRDLLLTGELYFRRADLFDDETEGLPPEEYLPVLGLDPLEVHDAGELNNHLGSDAHFRESFYVSCWHLFREETCTMWKQYGEQGVAIYSEYRLLKSALDEIPDRAFLGMVRYGSDHLTGWNVFRFIMTKRVRYTDEREVRALLWIIDPLAGGNRHIGPDNRVYPRPLTSPPSDRVPAGQRRKIDLQKLIKRIVVTPWASSELLDLVKRIVSESGCQVAVNPSELTRYRALLP